MQQLLFLHLPNLICTYKQKNRSIYLILHVCFEMDKMYEKYKIIIGKL